MALSKISNRPLDGASLLIAQDTPALSKLNFKYYIKTKPVDVLPPSMRCHADLQILYIGNGLFVSCPECFEYYKASLAPLGATVVSGAASLKGTYPYDAAYNICVAGKTAFCNTKIADSVALSLLSENCIDIVHVNQGYTKCSAAVVGENAIITADNGIYKAALTMGFDVLLIKPGGISLDGFDYGFFGGCCGKVSKNKLFLNGSIKNHPSRHKILSFLAKQDVEILEGADTKPADIGSLIIA